jgi:uncharacterized protein (TIGR02147 family)
MKRLYLYENYKKYVIDRLAELPKNGRGAFSWMAKAAQTYSSSLSQVFKGDKHLTMEQAAAISEFLEFSEDEATFFLLLVQHARAGSLRLKQILGRQIATIREKESGLEMRLPSEIKMAENEMATFYSDWTYSAVRMLSFIPETQTIEAMAMRLRLPRIKIQQAIKFLVDNDLCVEKKGKILPGSQHTHIGASSPWASRHHGNWRIMAMEKHPILSKTSELAYTSPVTLSRKDALRVRELLATLCEEVREVVDKSPSEALYCINLDWFEVRN